MQEFGRGDASNLFFHLHELETHRGFLCATAMNRHYQDLAVHDLLEPGFIQILCGIHEHTHHHRAVVFRFDSIDALVLSAELQAEVVQVHLVVHLLYPQGDYFELGQRLGVGCGHLETGRNEYLGLNLISIGNRGIVRHHHGMAAHIGLDAVHSGNLLHPGLECHGTAIALDGLEA